MDEPGIISYHLKGIGEIKINPNTGKMFCDTSIDSSSFLKRFDAIIQDTYVLQLGAQIRGGFDQPRTWHKYGKNYTVFLQQILRKIEIMLEKEG